MKNKIYTSHSDLESDIRSGLLTDPGKIADAVAELSNRSVTWHEDDFELRARESQAGRKAYDKKKFTEALYRMIRRHDAEIGVNWDTVDCYLEDCLKEAA